MAARVEEDGYLTQPALVKLRATATVAEKLAAWRAFSER
jgi:hypothetical protein